MQQTVNDSERLKIISIMMFGTFVAVLNQTLLTTALPEIMHDFNITSTDTQWLTTIFMLVNGIMIPITAFLVDRFTVRQLFLTAN